MIGVCFFVESRHPCGREIRTERWLSICRSFGVDKQLVINRSGKPCFVPAEDPDHPAELFDTLDAVRDAYPEHKFVMVERIPESTHLPDYEHPDNAIYVFGPDSGGIESIGRDGDDWLYIPTKQTKWGMWSDMCGAIVMQDRWLRGNNR